MVSGQGHHILGQSEESSVFHAPLMVSSLDLCKRKLHAGVLGIHGWVCRGKIPSERGDSSSWDKEGLC